MKNQLRAGVAIAIGMLHGTPAVATVTVQELQRVAARYNQSLPRMAAQTLRQEKVHVEGLVFTYVFTDLNRTGKQMVAANLEGNIRNDVFPEACQAPDTGRVIREGVTYRWIYFGKDNAVGAAVEVRPADCKGYFR